MRILVALFTLVNTIWASSGQDLTTTWVGIVSLVMFIVGYYVIAAEEKFHINKAKPAMFVGTFIFILIGFYNAINGIDSKPLTHEVEMLILEIAQIFFFLLVAMTYIEVMIERRVFDALKYRLVSKGYSFKKLFWLTGALAFFISPVADNLTTALILSTVLITIEKKNPAFLVPGAINIVVGANAGGAWSPFGDITTLMPWIAGKAEFFDFFGLFPAAFLGWLATGWLLSFSVPEGKPLFDVHTEERVRVLKGGTSVIYLGVFTIVCAVLCQQVFNIPPMWGMMFGFSLLKLYSYQLKRRDNEELKTFLAISKIEHDTLLFFFGILAAVGGLHFLGYLDLAIKLYESAGATTVNIGVGFLSAFIDNVPVMSAVLKANPNMGVDQWLLVTMTAGIGGSLISFGSAAGVGVMGKLRGIYTFGSHMKYAWTVLVGYLLSLAIWYVQFEILGLY
ncbi:sodium:proton antiporter NhaD [Sulfurospirillum arsenophilum]|uniref:sodium:proton antiporter NhaD n=1 Tax=Sulfurospirillum arsenophilum TaxID=56698 RepID=UPI0005A9226E|nr:sodium:proton antiporter NhaD [Sulfurospirillum arsenophilum]